MIRRMNRAEYLKAKEKIEAEYRKHLEALEIVWGVIGEDQGASAKTSRVVSGTAQTAKPTMTELVSEILPELEGDISQPEIYDRLSQRYSWIENKHKAYIAGVLTDLSKKHPPVLKLVTKARAGKPSVFRKVNERAINN